MQSIIVVSQDENQKQAFTTDILKKHTIDSLDVTVVDKDPASPRGQGGAIGIEAVRSIQKHMYLSPLRGKTKAIIIKNAETLTIEGQNALLKMLEEPPSRTLFVLLASSSEAFIPTVLSRCAIVTLQKNKDDEPDVTAYIDIVASLPKATIGEKLLLAQKAGTTKEQALAWLTNSILATRSILLAELDRGTINEATKRIIFAMQNAYGIIQKTNVSARIVLENMLLSL